MLNVENEWRMFKTKVECWMLKMNATKNEIKK